MRFSSLSTPQHESECRAASALVGARLQKTLGIANPPQPLQGLTLIICLSKREGGNFPMAATEGDSVQWPQFKSGTIEIIKELLWYFVDQTVHAAFFARTPA